ncbi:MAG TPA: hypothetical protein VMF13_24095 [Luteitalea sp.]|nr:hypothetical protein [Luteitalea sp.]
MTTNGTIAVLAATLTVAGAVAPLIGSAAPTTPVAIFDIAGRADSTPSIAASGRHVAVVWGASADGKADVYVAMSADRGNTFGTPVRVNRVDGEGRLGGELPPRVALTSSSRGGAPDVVVLWNARGTATEIKLSRSRDGGRTFETPVALQSAGAAGDRGWPALTLDARGTPHAVWLDHRGIAAKRAAAGGGPAAKHVHGAKPVDPDFAQGSSLYHATVNSKGAVEHAITRSVCYCCKTALASGPGNTLYAAWRHVYPGDLRDMAMSTSSDGGRTFSEPARISEDGWAIQGCPDDGPSAAVDSRGTVHVVWPTLIGGDSPEGALFYATTTDGRRFTPRVRVPTLGSPKPTHPQVAIHGGTVVVAWDESRDGRRVAAARAVRRTREGVVRFGDAVTIAPSGSASHPVLAATDQGLIAVWTTGGEQSRVEARRLSLP